MKHDLQHNAMDKNHRWADFPAVSGSGINRWFLTGVSTFKNNLLILEEKQCQRGGWLICLALIASSYEDVAFIQLISALELYFQVLYIIQLLWVGKIAVHTHNAMLKSMTLTMVKRN